MAAYLNSVHYSCPPDFWTSFCCFVWLNFFGVAKQYIYDFYWICNTVVVVIMSWTDGDGDQLMQPTKLMMTARCVQNSIKMYCFASPKKFKNIYFSKCLEKTNSHTLVYLRLILFTVCCFAMYCMIEIAYTYIFMINSLHCLLFCYVLYDWNCIHLFSYD